MEPPIFVVSPGELAKAKFFLPSGESHHAISVLRLSDGEMVLVVDGRGNACRGTVRIAGKVSAEIVVGERLTGLGEPSVRLTLAAGLSVGYKFDEIVDKGTQLGVSRFVPLLTDRSKIRLDDPKRAAGRASRLGKVALAAMKQCRRSLCPEIAAPVHLMSFLEEKHEDDLRLLFHPSGDSLDLEQVSIPEAVNSAIVLVGPESGFSPAEVEFAAGRGFQVIGLGNRVLRTETAGPTAVALVMARLGQFRQRQNSR